MRVGLFTALLAKLSLDEVIQKVKPLGIRTLELGVGNYPGEPHLKLEWLQQGSKLKEFKQKLEALAHSMKPAGKTVRPKGIAAMFT